MQAMYDSKTGKLTRRGDHDGTPRLWTVTNNLTYADGEKQKMTFRTKQRARYDHFWDEIWVPFVAHLKEEVASA